MNKTLTITLFLFSQVLFGQYEQYWENSAQEFPYFDFVSDNCPCITEGMVHQGLTESQLRAYRKAQYKADSLTRLDSPCYKYRAKFICGAPYPNKRIYFARIGIHGGSFYHPAPYDPANVDVELIFQKPLDRDSTVCPTWQLVIEKKKVLLKLDRQELSSGIIFCDFDQ